MGRIFLTQSDFYHQFNIFINNYSSTVSFIAEAIKTNFSLNNQFNEIKTNTNLYFCLKKLEQINCWHLKLIDTQLLTKKKLINFINNIKLDISFIIQFID